MMTTSRVKSLIVGFVLIPLGLAFAATSTMGQAAMPQSYSVQYLDDPYSLTSGLVMRTLAGGVNDHSHVVGRFEQDVFTTFPFYITNIFGFFYNGNDFITLNPNGSCDTQGCYCTALGINNSDVVVGFYGPVNSFGFSWTPTGGFQPINYPGATDTYPSAISNAGVVAGTFSPDDGLTSHGFLYSSGQFSLLDFPGTNNNSINGINSLGQVLGSYVDSGNQVHQWVYDGKTFNAFPSIPGAVLIYPGGINDLGQIVGTYYDSQNIQSAFRLDPNGKVTNLTGPGFPDVSRGNLSGVNNSGVMAAWGVYDGNSSGLIAQAVMVDPVTDLLAGPAIIKDTLPNGPDLLATSGTPVQGIAADGVTEVVLRLPANNAGDQFTLQLFNDQYPTASLGSPNEDGALGFTGDTVFSQSQITVTAKATTKSGPMAFAVYRAPLDFVRPSGSHAQKSVTCNGATGSDSQLACRAVTIKVQGPSSSTTFNVMIVRPPVMLIHGLWGDQRDFAQFLSDPTTHIGDPRFFQGFLAYTQLVGNNITATDPTYSSGLVSAIRANSMGFQFNVPTVMEQMYEQLLSFKGGFNTISAPIAAVQADLIAHSMGGTIIRTVAAQGNFLRDDNFAQGDVHKLITIDTPHLGSPLASQLLFGDINSCVRGVLAYEGDISLRTTVLYGTQTFTGAVADLQDNTGISGQLSPALQEIASANQHPLPTAFVVGYMQAQNRAGLDSWKFAQLVIHGMCGTGHGDPLGNNFTSTSIANVFGGADSDGIVSLASQENNPAGSPANYVPIASVFPGYVHGSGAIELGFVGPQMLDPTGNVPLQVINLLNTAVTDPAFNLTNP
jgi:pimeloyl-ACP methyl ester carboxylesterase